MPDKNNDNKTDNDPSLEKQVLAIVKQFLIELEAERATRSLSLRASLEYDLGIDSLGRVELFHRLEQAFGIQLPQKALVRANKIKDLIRLVSTAQPTVFYHPKDFAPSLAESAFEPTQAKTLTNVLFMHAEQQPERPHIYLQDEQGQETIITYGELLQQAQIVASSLIEKGIKPSESIALMLPTCHEFFYVFMGIQLAGAVPVPIYPPFRADRIEEYAKREAKILSNAEVRLLITFHRAESLSILLSSFIPSLKTVLTPDQLLQQSSKHIDIAISGDEAGLIQYTSGSTGDPKGVLLTHNNLLANIRAGGKALGVKPNDVVVSWLPLYHDMGLIGTWMGSLYFGVPVVIMSPLSFLSRPERWLWTIHYHRGTISGGPNFSYELCLNRINPKQIEGLDLSSWRVIFNGAEAIYPQTLRNFAKQFAPYGLKEKSLFPVYGLAESSVALVFPPLDRKPVFDTIRRDEFEQQQRAVPSTGNGKQSLEFVSVGQAIPGHEIRIIDDANQIVSERTIGQLQFRGPSTMQGYYRNRQMTEQVIHDGWVDTGDLAYLADNELYITGRRKDVIIKAGRNIYPEEIEKFVAQIPGVRRGCVATFGVGDPRVGTEKLIIVAETRVKKVSEKQKIRQKIIEQLVDEIGMPPDQVLLVAPRTVPKTSSGKLRRSSCKNAYLKGKIGRRYLPVWAQYLKLLFGSSRRLFSRAIGKVGRLIYTLYVGLLFLISMPVVWLLLLIAKQPTAAIICKFWARGLLTLCFCPIKVEGVKQKSFSDARIYVVNHASYVDSFVLMAAMPSHVLQVGKKELIDVPITGFFIKRLGYIMIERIDFSQSVAAMDQLEQQVEQGSSVLIFPEGTFTYATGLRPFKLGAFKLAVDTQKMICPMALKGTRTMLRADRLLPRPAKITVTFGDCIQPQGNDWQEVARLRDATREFIAEHSGEKTLNLIRAGFEN